jgi:hypothetical protein
MKNGSNQPSPPSLQPTQQIFGESVGLKIQGISALKKKHRAFRQSYPKSLFLMTPEASKSNSHSNVCGMRFPVMLFNPGGC